MEKGGREEGRKGGEKKRGKVECAKRNQHNKKVRGLSESEGLICREEREGSGSDREEKGGGMKWRRMEDGTKEVRRWEEKRGGKRRREERR